MGFLSFFNHRSSAEGLPSLQQDAEQRLDRQFEAKRRSVFMQMRYMRERSKRAKRTKASNIWKNTLILARPKDWLRLIAIVLCLGLLLGYVASVLIPHLSKAAEITPLKHPPKPLPPILLPLDVESSEGVQLQFSRSLSQPTN